MLLTSGKSETLLDRALVTAFLQNVPDIVYFKDCDSRFIAVSESTARKHGLKVADIIGKSDFDFFPEPAARRFYEDEQRIIKTGQPMLGKLEKETWPDGRVTWSLSCKMPLRDGHGTIIGTFGLGKNVTESKRLEAALEKVRRELQDASRMAGMAEVATSVLHNVGNVLNSLNVSSSVLGAGLRDLKTDSLAKIGELLHEHAADLGDFLDHDPKGRLVPAFIESLARHFSEDRIRLLQEIESLRKNVEHVKEIVSMQQSYAAVAGIVEPLAAAGLMEDALRINFSTYARHDIQVARDFAAVPPIIAERGKVLQILVNLIRNAKYACDASQQPDKIITLRLAAGPAGRVRLIVQDNGVGLSGKNLTRIFQHGFTTKPKGHGFGLHSSANAAAEMKGTLTVYSDGPGTGATFTLELPAAATNAMSQEEVSSGATSVSRGDAC